jgi:peptidoglycan/xylan/chitin deacetylase (PgdA/CDA1 family)
MFDMDDVRAACARGHEIACHTYTHIDCAAAEVSRLRSEISTNAVAAAQTGAHPLVSFSYPFGRVSRPASRAVRPFFSSCRGIQPGINEGVPDYSELRANKIYHRLFDEGQMHALIDRNLAVGGWLIFYTHDVCEAPSAYGCTERELDIVARYAASRSAVLPVREVVSAMNIAPRPR